MADAAVENFAKLLANADEIGRQRLHKQATMIAMNEAEPENYEPPVKTLGEYLDTPIPVPPTLVHPGLIVRGAITVTVGRAGIGKTVMNLNRIIRWSAGLPMFDGLSDIKPDEPIKTLIVENEGAPGLFHKQIGLMLANSPLTKAQREQARDNIFVWGDGGYSGLKLDEEKYVDNLRAGVEKHEPDLLFIEPFRGLWSGEENSSTDMAVVLDAIMGIASDELGYNVGVLVAHHERKSGVGEDGEYMSAARGSGALEGTVAVMENWKKVKGNKFRELDWSKNRHAESPVAVRMEWDRETWWYRWVEPSEVESAILATLQVNPDEPMGVKDIMDETDEKEHKVRSVLKDLQESSRLKKMAGVPGLGGPTYRLNTTDPDNGLEI